MLFENKIGGLKDHKSQNPALMFICRLESWASLLSFCVFFLIFNGKMLSNSTVLSNGEKKLPGTPAWCSAAFTLAHSQSSPHQFSCLSCLHLSGTELVGALLPLAAPGTSAEILGHFFSDYQHPSLSRTAIPTTAIVITHSLTLKLLNVPNLINKSNKSMFQVFPCISCSKIFFLIFSGSGLV